MNFFQNFMLFSSQKDVKTFFLKTCLSYIFITLLLLQDKRGNWQSFCWKKDVKPNFSQNYLFSFLTLNLKISFHVKKTSQNCCHNFVAVYSFRSSILKHTIIFFSNKIYFLPKNPNYKTSPFMTLLRSKYKYKTCFYRAYSPTSPFANC